MAAARQATGWLVCRDMASERDLVRLRWALAETGRVARCVLIEPEVDAPGWWPVSDAFSSWEEMLQEIGGEERAAAALMAALLEREPGTGELAGALRRASVSLAEQLTELRELDDPGATLARLANRHELIAPDAVIVRRAAPAVLRALDHEATIEDARAGRVAEATAALARWCTDSGHADGWSLDDATLWAWAGMAPTEVPLLTIERPPRWSSVYWLEATLGKEQPSPAAVAWARELAFDDVVTHWLNVSGLGQAEPRAQIRQDDPGGAWAYAVIAQHLDKKWADARMRVDLADVLGSRGQHREAERLLRRALDALEISLGSEHPDVVAVLDSLANVLKAQGRYDEAASLWRRGLSINDHTREAVYPVIPVLQREWGHMLQVLHDVRALASYNELGDMEMAAGNLDAARAHYSAGLELATKLADMVPDNGEAQRDLLASELRLARLEIRAQQVAEARRHLGAARAVLERLDASGRLRGDALLEKYRHDIVAIECGLSP